MKRRKLCVFLMLFLSLFFSACSWFDLPQDVYGRKAQFEYHHVFPQEYYGSEGNGVTVRMRNYEHYRWVHGNSNFNKDWKKVDDKEDIDAYAQREAAFIAGANFVSYRWLAYDYDTRSINGSKPLFAMHFDGVSNVIYNVSYLTSIPYKFIRFTIMCIGSIPDFGFGYALMMFIWMIIELFLGLMSACFMLILGFLIGALWHPLQTLGHLTINIAHPFKCNLLATIWDGLGAIFRPLIRIIIRV